jgi:phosphohistidine phosphatase SixA
MRAVLYIICILALSIFWAPFKTTADQRDLIERLKVGGHILMVRHALAPGTGDPPNFKITDCTTQRNLDETGRAQARDIGDWLRSNGVSAARVYSSQWCRCLKTGKLMDLGPVGELPALNSFYQRIQDREPNLKALNDFISRQPTDGDLIVLVTHFVTIGAITGESVSSGEGVVLELGGDSGYTVVGRTNF